MHRHIGVRKPSREYIPRRLDRSHELLSCQAIRVRDPPLRLAPHICPARVSKSVCRATQRTQRTQRTHVRTDCVLCVYVYAYVVCEVLTNLALWL